MPGSKPALGSLGSSTAVCNTQPLQKSQAQSKLWAAWTHQKQFATTAHYKSSKLKASFGQLGLIKSSLQQQPIAKVPSSKQALGSLGPSKAVCNNKPTLNVPSSKQALGSLGSSKAVCNKQPLQKFKAQSKLWAAWAHQKQFANQTATTVPSSKQALGSLDS